jgi:hypothetical protein
VYTGFWLYLTAWVTGQSSTRTAANEMWIIKITWRN